MQSTFRRFLVICVVLILTLGSAHAAPSKATFSFIGTFSNVRHTSEHAYGYSVQLWKSGNKIVGLLSSANGLADDTPIGQMQNVHWNPVNGALSFTAKLSTASLYLGNGKTKPTHDIFTFNGALENGKVLAGNLSRRDLIQPDHETSVEHVRLVKTSNSPEIQAATLKRWQQDADRILKFRGPKW